MNFINKYKYLFAGLGVAAALVVGSGCSKLDINSNPNEPTQSQGTPAVVFPAGVLSATGYIGGNLGIVGGMWSQYYTQSPYDNQYTDVDAYNMPNSDGFVTGTWDNLFTGALVDFQTVIHSSDSLQDWTYYLMAQTMKAYVTSVMVDLWSTMPYTQAFQGKDNLNPTWDSGLTIYNALIDSINLAQGKDFTALTNSQPSADQDPLFGGNASEINNWIAFGNTLKLRMYLRMWNTQPAIARAGITALLSAGGPFLTKDAAFTNFSNAPGLDNPMYEQNIRELNTNSNLKASTTLVTWLNEYNDPRVIYWFGGYAPSSVDQGNYRLILAGYSSAPTFNETPTDPVEFISLAESDFLQAEALIRINGNGAAGAQALYEAGVERAFSEIGFSGDTLLGKTPGAAPYFGAYAWGKETEGGATLTNLQQIWRQKWAECIYGCHGIEAWFEQNRNGFPTQSPVYSTDPSYIPGQIVVVPNTVLSAGQLPRRFPFPYDETNRNSSSPNLVPIYVPVWWAQ
jgi:hypothetical protein